MTDRRLHSRALGAAAVLAWATTIGYVLLLVQQDTVEPLAGRVVVVAATMLLLGLAAAIGAFMPRPTSRVVLAAVVVGGLLPLGVLAAMSIGVPLVVAGLLALVAGLQALPASAPRTLLLAAAAAIASVTLLAVGLLVT